MALEAAGLRPEARRVVRFLDGLDLDDAARFYPDGSRVPGRAAAGDGEGWVRAAKLSVDAPFHGAVRTSPPIGGTTPDSSSDWLHRQDYGENVTGDLLANAIASGVPAAEIKRRFLTRAAWSASRARASWTQPPPGRSPSSPAGVCARRQGPRS